MTWNTLIAGTPLRRWAAYAGLLAGGILFPIRVGVVSGDSMDPSLHDGQAYLFAPRPYSRSVNRGDVVVFQYEGESYVKRVLAGPGDSLYVLRYRDQGDEVVSEQQLERLIRKPVKRAAAYMQLVHLTVPPGRMYVIGDHLSSSFDSREFGPVSLSSITGKVLFAPPAQPEFTSLAARPLPPRI